MNSVVEWQKELDSLFPKGALVTVVNNDPSDTERGTSFATGHLRVEEVTDSGTARVVCFPLSFSKDVRFDIKELRPQGQAWFAVPEEVEEDRAGYLLNSDMGADNEKYSVQWRKEVGL